MLSLHHGHVVRHKISLQITGGATESIFPEVENLLFSGDYYKALAHVAARKSMDKYRSVMDFLFCELHQEWRSACQRFYSGQGQPLRELISETERQFFNNRLLTALNIAHEEYMLQCHISWGQYCEKVEEALSTAA
jgi:hypothetical protein